MKGLSKKYISRLMAVVLSGGTTFLKALTTIFNSWLIIHFVSLELWGAFTVFLVTLNFIGLFVSFGNKEYLVREFSKNPAQQKQLWNHFFWNRIPLLILALAFWLFANRSVSILVLCGLWTVFLFIQQSFDALNLATKNFRFPFFLELTSALLSALIIILFHESLDLNTLVLLYALMQTAKGIAQFFVYKAYLQWPPNGSGFLLSIRELLPFFSIALGGLLLDKADLLCVSIYLPDKLKAGYQILSGLSGIGLVAISSFLIPFSRNLFRMSHTAHFLLHKRYFIFGLFFSIAFILFAYEFLSSIFHLQFSGFVYLFLFLSQLFFIFYFPFLILFTKLNWQTPALVLILISGAINLLLSFVLTPIYQLEGAIAASAIGHLVLGLSQLIFYKRKQIHA